MHLPIKISFYIARQFLQSFLLVFAVITCIIFLVDILELIRRAYNKDVPFSILMEMVLFKFPITLQKFAPFAALVASVLTYSKLTRSNELVVTRAAGVSAWQFLIPSILTAFAIGIFLVALFNPVACSMSSRYEQIEGKYLSGRANLLAISPYGLWLRQKSGQNSDGQVIIHALRASKENMSLSEAVFFEFKDSDTFVRRFDVKTAKLVAGAWELEDVIVSYPSKTAERLSKYSLPTDLTENQIQESFASPESISFWELPNFIKTLKESGFSAQKHRMYFYNVMVSPLFIASMVLIAALFALRLPRQGKTSMLLTASIVAGFVIYFFTDLISAFGISARIPVEVAALVPAIINLLIGISLMLHLEES